MGRARPSAPPRVTFVTTAGPAIGLGHLQRCLTLATALRDDGADVRFWLRGDAESGNRVIRAGFDLTLMEAPAQLLRRVPRAEGTFVVDDYDWDTGDFEALSRGKRPVAVIDDLATRELPVDLVVNGSIRAAQLRYTGGSNTRFLLGPDYALLRATFADVPDRPLRRSIERLLITVGGADPLGVSALLIARARVALPEAVLDVVVGPLFDARLRTRLARLAADRTICLHDDPSDMRGLMLRADAAVSASGQTLYELAACATPSICFLAAENQDLNARSFNDLGAARFIGSPGEPSFLQAFGGALAALDSSTDERRLMSESARALVDGRGTRRVAEAIQQLAAA